LFQQLIFTRSGKLGALLPATKTSDEDHCMLPTDSRAGTSNLSYAAKKEEPLLAGIRTG
jgi:hypothetical protein